MPPGPDLATVTSPQLTCLCIVRGHVTDVIHLGNVSFLGYHYLLKMNKSCSLVLNHHIKFRVMNNVALIGKMTIN